MQGSEIPIGRHYHIGAYVETLKSSSGWIYTLLPVTKYISPDDFAASIPNISLHCCILAFRLADNCHMKLISPF